MTKLEKEKAIIEKLKYITNCNNESDKRKREMIARQTACGTNPDVWKDVFFFNGYMYMDELRDIICYVMFDKSETVRVYEKGFKYSMPLNNLTNDEQATMNKIIDGMVKANIIKVSKTGSMVKLLKED